MTTVYQSSISAASDLVKSLGVNIHASTYEGAYQNSSLILESLSFLGISNVRNTLASYGVGAQVLDALADAGVNFDFVTANSMAASGSAGLTDYVAQLKSFLADHAGAINSLEGMNEINLFSFTYNGSSSISAGAEYQKAFYNAINADATLADIPVINLSLAHYNSADYAQLGDLANYSDYANVHSYMPTYTAGDTSMESYIKLSTSVTEGGPFMVTELGYTTDTSEPTIGTNESAQAKLILNGIMDAFENGSANTYLYELFDNTQATGSYGQDDFGLFRSDGSPKLAASAIHNLTTILSYSGAASSTASSSFTYTLGNMPGLSHQMVLAKGNGGYDLVLWAEPTVWNDTTDTEIKNAATNVTVKLGSVQAVVYVYDPLVGTNPIAVYKNVSSINVALSDHPLIVEVGVATPVTETVETVAANLTMTADQLVSQIDDLAAAQGLQTVTLTDSHVLHVSSMPTLKYMIANYQDVLSKIKGGYQFSLELEGKNWLEVKTYDKSANLLSTAVTSYNNGVAVAVETNFADGSRDVVRYGITGQKFTTQEMTYDASGSLTHLVRWHADGTLAYDEKRSAGTLEFTTYDATGHKLNHVVKVSGGDTLEESYSAATGLLTFSKTTHADGSIDNYTYNAAGTLMTHVSKHVGGTYDIYNYHLTGLPYASQEMSYGADGKVYAITRWHADGSLAYEEVKGNGSFEWTSYNSTGHKMTHVLQITGGDTTVQNYSVSTGYLLNQKITHADGSSAYSVYNTSGILATLTEKHADGSRDIFDYHISGQSYATQEQSFNAAGTLTAINRWHADGTNAYQETRATDGSSVIKTFDSTGHLYEQYNNAANGAKEYIQYSTGVAGEVKHSYYGADGLLDSTDRVEADGSHIVWGFDANKTMVGGTGNDVFYFGGAKALEYDGGIDEVYNFTSSNKIIVDHQFSGLASSMHLVQSGSDTIVQLDHDHQILLHNTWATSVSSGQFVFA